MNVLMLKCLYGFCTVYLYGAYVCTSRCLMYVWRRLYRDHGKIDSFQMMCGVNISSICLTSLALVFAGEIPMVTLT